jgi:hypothetical protein
MRERRWCATRAAAVFLQVCFLFNCGGGGGGQSVSPNRPPAITSGNGATFVVGTAGTFAVTATGSPPPTLSESGTLPSGVTFNASTGVLSGTPGAGTGGTYPMTFTASNGVLPNATQNFMLTVNQPPAITSGNGTTFVVGAAGSFAVTATGFPAPTLSDSGLLPSGVMFNATTGVLSGTPGAGTGGTYPITITASNGVTPNATQNFTLTVNQAPAVTSGNSTTFTVGAAGSFTVTATGFPAPTFSETGALPSGVTLGTGGVLSGTPGAGTGGTYPITITNSNGVTPDATQSFTLTVNQAPAVTSGNSTTFTVGAAGSFTVTATGFPAPTFSETGALPSGVTLGTGGVLSGTPGAGTGGTYPITFTAGNGVGTDATQSFTLTVNQAPAITSGNGTTFVADAAGTFTVTATGFPAPTFSETGALPSGVTLNSTTGVLGGTPAASTGGTYPITITASNGVTPHATQNFTLTVNQPPAITSGSSTTFTVGTAGSFTVTATGFPTPTLSDSGLLPSGVMFNATTGVLSGIPGAGTGGTYAITFTASNGVTPNATQSFTLTVNQPPAITSASSATFVVGTAGSFPVTATGFPAPTFGETGALPSGVTLNSTTGVLSGAPGAGTGGTYAITFTASNGVTPNATQSFTLTVNQAPAITSGNSATFTVGTAGSFTVTATGFPAPTLSESGTLPSGVTFNASTGVLTGTPAAGTGGTYPITFAANNGVLPNAIQIFTLTVDNPEPVLSSISPPTVDAGTDATLTVNGTGFVQQSVVHLNGTSVGTTFGGPTQLTAVIPSAQLTTAGTFAVTVLNPSPGGGTSNAANLTVLITVTVSPSNPIVLVSDTQPFTAMVAGATDHSVTWSVTCASGGTACGSISSINSTSGLYVAPDSPPSPDYTVTVTATSVVEPTRTASALVAVVNPAPILASISPKAATVGDWDVALWVFGSDFVAQSTVYATVNATRTRLTTAFVSSTTLSATIDHTMLASAQTLTITVVTLPPVGGTTTGANFTVYAKNYPRSGAGSVVRTSPALSSIVPGSGKSVVAVLDWATDGHKHPDDTQEDVLAACHVLAPSGIPHVHVTSVPNPAVYPFLAVAGTLEFPGQLTDTERDALQAYVQNGGTLFLWLPSDTGLLTRLGLSVLATHTDASNTYKRPLTFDTTTGDHALSYIDYSSQSALGEEAEIDWQMVYPGGDIPTYGYSSPGAGQVLASWQVDGTAAVVRTDLGTGRAYVFGWRLRHIVTEAEREIDSDESLYRVPWTDTPRLGADICRLLVRGAYEGWAGTNAQIRAFAPDGKKAALIVTHDVDDATSYEQMPVFAQYESSQGITATYNLTTSPYDNGEEAGFYNASGIQDAKDALALGHDIESHSFGHFWDFATAAYSLTPAETAANYQPYDPGCGSPPSPCTTGMSVLGEEGVSRWLLENDLTIIVEGFRSGYLAIPARFFEGLSNTGYLRDSSTASGATRGSFPFVAFVAPGGAVTAYPITEYPIALSDDELQATPDGPGLPLDEVLAKWENVILANYNNNAPTVLLIHTSLPGPRLAAEQGIIQWVKDNNLDLWIGDLKTFGQFWQAQGVVCEKGW